ncbi:Elongator subunit elp4 [Gurleya vavrai]
MENLNVSKQILFGNSFLDDNLGLIKNGSLILIKEDEYSYHNLTLLKTFIAQNIDNTINILTKDFKQLKIPNLAIQKEITNDEIEKMVIAWRYDNLIIEKSIEKFDLRTTMDTENKKLKFNTTFNVNEFIKELSSLEKDTICIAISLLSPAWNNLEIDEPFLFEIKKICRQNNLVFLATCPTFLHKNINFDLYFDFVLSLNSHAFTNFFPNYDGILEIEKMYFLNNIKENKLQARKFGFNSNRGGLCIEKICLPPDDISQDEIKSCANSLNF